MTSGINSVPAQMGMINESEVMEINGFYRFIQRKHFIVTSISVSRVLYSRKTVANTTNFR